MPQRTDPAVHLAALLENWASEDSLALGHQDATLYGVGWQGDEDRSDVQSLTGRSPLVLGFELGGLGQSHNLDGVPFDRMLTRMREGHARGAALTASFHLHNVVSDKDAWDTTPAVKALLPGGSAHAAFEETLARLSAFFAELRQSDGQAIPVLFRPFHEHNGSWFWWGRDHTSDEDYVALFRYAVDYLRRHNPGQLLFAFSPGGAPLRHNDDYFFRYPGDEWVDVLGVDHYFGHDSASLVRAVEITVSAALARKKVAALSEFGLLGSLAAPACDPEAWFTKHLLGPLLESPLSHRLSYALAWRNADTAHFFLPYPGHALAADFQDFCKSPFIRLGPPSSIDP